jgi:hypothetical protein
LGQFFAQRATVFFGKIFENPKSSPLFFGYFFPLLRLCIDFGRKWLGIHFGRFFSQTHLVTLKKSPSSAESGRQSINAPTNCAADVAYMKQPRNMPFCNAVNYNKNKKVNILLH